MKRPDSQLTLYIAKITGPLFILALLFFLAMGANYIIHLPMFNITRIMLEPKEGRALNYVSPASLQTTLNGRISGNFFTAPLPQIQKVAETSPWVRNVDITRLWPNGLLFKVEEQEPFAVWNDEQMVNTWGEVFAGSPDEYDGADDLPIFSGPEGSEKLVVQRYGELVRWLAPLKLNVKKLSLNERYAWTIGLNNGMEIVMGRDPGAEAANPYDEKGADSFASSIQRFVQVWPALLKKINGRKVKKVDLRYTTGLAITFADSPSEK